jgi:hypothetical protein
MTPQERELLTNLISRLRQAPAQAKDREADQLIADLVRERPDAPYLLAQTVLIQDYSLHQAQSRIAELESQPPAASAGAGSFLGGLFGRGQPAAAPSPAPAPAPQPAGGPWGSAAAAAPGAFSPAAGGGSFLRSAAATAAGVAGGALLFSGIQSLFGHGLGGLGGLGGQAFAAQPSITETVINNFGAGDAAASSVADPGGALDPGGLAGDQPIPDFTPATDDLADADFDPGGDFSDTDV